MRKIIVFFIMTLLIATALPAVGIINKENEIINKNLYNLDDHDLEIDWERLYGDSDDDLFRNVKQTSDGGYICVGVKDGQSHWLFKIDANGDEEWSQTTLPNPELWPRCYIVEETSDGGFVTSGCHEDNQGFGYDRCIWKVDSNGDSEWCTVYDDPEFGYHMCIQETNDGGYIISGEIDVAPGDWDALLMKTDSNGNVEWQKVWSYGEFGDCAYAVRQTPDGGYILSGRKGNSASQADFLIIKADSDGNKEWDKIYGGEYWEQSQSNDILFTSDGGYIFLAETRSYGAGNQDIWLIKTDSQGDMLWNKTFGGRKTDMCGGMDFTDDGGIIIAASKNSWDMMTPKGSGLVIKTDENGNVEWQKEFGYDKEDQLQSVCSTNDGGYIVAGLIDSTSTTGAGLYDAWLIKIKQFDNNQPEKPDTPSGKKRGKPDTDYTFSTSTSDSEGDAIYYMWDWGDGNFSDWLETGEANHTWTTENTFEIKVMAKDEHGGESDWSDPLSFSTPKNKEIFTFSDLKSYIPLDVPPKWLDGSDQTQTITGDYGFIIQPLFHCAQEFKPTKDDLTAVALPFFKFGSPPSDTTITISIREELDGNDLTTTSIDADSWRIKGLKWTLFDFDDIVVTPEESYYIVCTADKGDYDPDGNDSNTYCWNFEFDNKYYRGIAFQSNDSGLTWLDLEDPFDDPEYVECDFAFITYYQEPKGKEINLFDQLIERLIERFPILEILFN